MWCIHQCKLHSIPLPPGSVSINFPLSNVHTEIPCAVLPLVTLRWVWASEEQLDRGKRPLSRHDRLTKAPLNSLALLEMAIATGGPARFDEFWQETIFVWWLSWSIPELYYCFSGEIAYICPEETIATLRYGKWPNGELTSTQFTDKTRSYITPIAPVYDSKNCANCVLHNI